VSRRNADTDEDLNVALASNDDGEAIVDAEVTIPAGEEFVEFQITPVDDVELDGIQEVTISASAAGFAGDSDKIMVLDEDGVPDAQIRAGKVATDSVTATSNANVQADNPGDNQ
jgi:hypothetical protein